MRTTALLLIAAALAGVASAAEPGPPFGGKDYYPSADRPIGWRGDGSGWYPGATPVSEFTEGTPTTVTLPVHDPKRGRSERVYPEVSDDRRRNVVWHTRMPSYAQSQPIIVGDKAFTTADPDMLVCVDMNTGKVLWQRRSIVFEALALPGEEVARLDAYLSYLKAACVPLGGRLGGYGRFPKTWDEEHAPLIAECKLSRRILARLVDEHPYGEEARPYLEKFDQALAALEALEPGDASERSGRPMKEAVSGAGRWIQDRYRFPTDMLWDPHIGWSFPTPCSDGQAVYVTFGQGQTAAYDLAGRRLWIRFKPYPGRINPRAKHCPSPRLAGDVLVVQSPEALLGLDKRTGRMLWERPDISVGIGYKVGSHHALRLPSGRWILATTADAVLDARTGTTLCDLDGIQGAGGETGGSSIVGHGNRVYLNGARDRRPTSACFAFTEDGDRHIVRTKLFDVVARYRHNFTPILADGFVYIFHKGHYAIDAADGSYVGTHPRRWPYFGGLSPVLAGKVFFRAGGRDRRRSDLRLVSEIVTHPLLAPGKVGDIRRNNLVVESDPPPDFRVEEYGSEIYKTLEAIARMSPAEAAKYFSYGSPFYNLCGGLPDNLGYGGFCATGNRVVLRTTCSLVCIGDPTEPYDWNPASRTTRRPTDQAARLAGKGGRR